jgi:formylglycine-generating enzyme required for sulfatase activity
LDPFRIADGLVTNQDWLAFIDDGGYRRAELWLSDGWNTVTTLGWAAPLYWHALDGQWQHFTLRGMQPVDPRRPVSHVSHYEADAFARWASRRLPTEHDALWQWTSSAYLPYPRFVPASGAVGEYNGKFMSGQMVLRGGASVTPPGHVRPTYRNFFPPASRWPFTGLRLADDR